MSITQTPTLTEEEIIALPMEFNLADGHAYRPWSKAELTIIENVSELFLESDRRDLDKIEKLYLEAFFAAAGQSYRPDKFNHFMCFTASTALEVIANFLRTQRLSVSLIEPCFDNLPDILVRHGVNLTVFHEDMMLAEGCELNAYLDTIKNEAIMLVSPNNPSGLHLKQRSFEQIVDFCQTHSRILILDSTFRFYLPENDLYDQYKILSESDIDCIMIEDTGKTWPTLEIKAPFFSVSSRIAPRLAHIYSDFILHVSPIAPRLLKRFIDIGMGHIKEIISINRATLRRAVQHSILLPISTDYISVEWLEIKADITSKQLKADLALVGVQILAGNQFYWSDTSRGDRYVRIALARDPVMFQGASIRIEQFLRSEQFTGK